VVVSGFRREGIDGFGTEELEVRLIGGSCCLVCFVFLEADIVILFDELSLELVGVSFCACCSASRLPVTDHVRKGDIYCKKEQEAYLLTSSPLCETILYLFPFLWVRHSIPVVLFLVYSSAHRDT
jgi:hypothetical protein